MADGLPASLTDSTAPTLQSLSLTGPFVDPATNKAFVRLQAQLSDAMAGIISGGFRYGSSDGSQSIWLSFQRENLIKGDANDGIVLAIGVLPDNAVPGTWRLDEIRLQDMADNSILYLEAGTGYFGSPSAIATLGLASSATSFEVVSSTTDAAAPVLKGLTITGPSIDPATGQAFVRLQAELSDAVAGMSSGSFCYRSPDGSQSVWFNFQRENLIKGDANDGIVLAIGVLPNNAAPGTWTLDEIRLQDQASNSITYNNNWYNPLFINGPSAITSLGLASSATSFEVVNSAADTTAPVLTGLTITGPSIDPATGQAFVRLQAELSDAVAGISGGSFCYRSPDGSQSVWFTFDRESLVKGNSNNGIALATGVLPVNAVAGTWTLTEIQLQDQANNSITYNDNWYNPLFINGPSAITSLGLPSSATSFEVARGSEFVYLSDSDEPIPLEIRLAATTVDLSSGATNLPFEIDFTDDVAGLERVYISFKAPSGPQQHQDIWLYTSSNLLSGNSLDGTLASSILLPQYAEEGRWSLQSISLSDTAGNQIYLWGSSDTNSHSSLDAYGLGDVSFVAGDLAEWDRSIVFEGNTANLLITASNQRPGSKLYYTLSGEGETGIRNEDFTADIRKGWIALDENKQARIPISLASDNISQGDEWLYADLFTDESETVAVGSGAAIKVADRINTVVDLSKYGQQAITARARWEDLSGLDSASLSFTRIDENVEAGSWNSSGELDDSPDVEIEFNAYRSLLADSQSPSEEHTTLFTGDISNIREAGIYELTSITFSDKSREGNYRWYERNSTNTFDYDHNLENFLIESGLNASMFRFEAVGTPKAATVISDTALPELKAFRWGETIRGMEDGSGLLSAEASFQDEYGLGAAWLQFRSGDHHVSLEFSDTTTRLADDTTQKQRHASWLSIPFNAEPGTYSLESINLDDQADNHGYLSGNTLTNYLTTLGLSADQFTFTVSESWPMSQPVETDLDAPELIGLALASRELDLATGEGLVVNAKIRETNGIYDGSLVWRKTDSSDKQDSLRLDLSDWYSLAAFDGTAEQHVGILFAMPSTTSGSYKLSGIEFGDSVGNGSDLSDDALGDYLQSVGLNLDDFTITVVGTQPEPDTDNPTLGGSKTNDSDPPVLQNFELDTINVQPGASHQLDQKTGANKIRIELDVSDDLSGFVAAGSEDHYMGEVELLHSNGSDRIWTSISASNFKPKDSQQGTFVVTIPVDETTRNGLWSIASVSLRDQAGNWRDLDQASYNSNLANLSRELLAQRLGLSSGQELGIEISGGLPEGQMTIPQGFAPRIQAVAFDQNIVDLSSQSDQQLSLKIQLNAEDLAIIQEIVGGSSSPGLLRDSEACIENAITGDQQWADITVSQEGLIATFELGTNTPSGIWQLEHLVLPGRTVTNEWSGEGYFLSSSEEPDLRAELIASRLNVQPALIRSEVINPARPKETLKQDNTAPLITSVHFGTDQIDMSEGSGVLKCYLDFMDMEGELDGNGPLGVLELISADGQQSVWYDLTGLSSSSEQPEEATVRLIDGGDLHQGQLEISIPLNASLRSGQWFVSRLSIRDRSDNLRTINLLINEFGNPRSAEAGSGYFGSSGIPDTSVEQLAERLGSQPGDISFNIINGGTGELGTDIDTAAPLIKALRISTAIEESAPSFDSGSSGADVSENTIGNLVYDAETTDGGDISGSVVYSLKAATDDELSFGINASTGEVTQATAFDYESKTGYRFTVVATDAAGNATEQVVTGNILNVDEIAATITGISTKTTNASYNAGDIIDLSIGFSENVFVVGTPQLMLETGATDRQALYISGSGTSTLLFRYVVQPGDTSADLEYISSTALTLNGGNIQDAAGNNASLKLPEPAGTGSLGNETAIIIDTTGPVFTSKGIGTPLVKNSGPGQTIYTAVTTGDRSVVYALADSDDGSLFAIDSFTGVVKITDNPTKEAQSSYRFSVLATDGAGNTTAQEVTVAVVADVGLKRIEDLQTVVQGLNLDTITADNPAIEQPVLQVLKALQGDQIITNESPTTKEPIRGTSSDDVIAPVIGRSALIGGGGADAFAFVEPDKFGKRGADRITDFKTLENDKIILSDTAFPGLTSIRFKTVRSKNGLNQAYRSGSNIIYDQTTGSLYFDSNGAIAGRGTGGLFATLNGRPVLTANDFALFSTDQLFG